MHICPRHQFSTASSMHICLLHDSHAGNAYIVTYAHHAASALYQGMAGFWGCAVMHASSHQTESVGWLRTYPQQGRLVCMRQAVCAYALQILLCRLAALQFLPKCHRPIVNARPSSSAGASQQFRPVRDRHKRDGGTSRSYPHELRLICLWLYRHGGAVWHVVQAFVSSVI